LFGGGDGCEQGNQRRAERGPIGVRNAEQLADRGERQRERERGDQIDPALRSPRGNGVEKVVDDALHAWTQSVDSAYREGGRAEKLDARAHGQRGWGTMRI